MSSLDSCSRDHFPLQQSAYGFSKSIAPIRNGKQFERITGPNFPPPRRNGLRGRAGRQRAFKFVRSD